MVVVMVHVCGRVFRGTYGILALCSAQSGGGIVGTAAAAKCLVPQEAVGLEEEVAPGSWY